MCHKNRISLFFFFIDRLIGWLVCFTAWQSFMGYLMPKSFVFFKQLQDDWKATPDLKILVIIS